MVKGWGDEPPLPPASRPPSAVYLPGTSCGAAGGRSSPPRTASPAPASAPAPRAAEGSRALPRVCERRRGRRPRAPSRRRRRWERRLQRGRPRKEAARLEPRRECGPRARLAQTRRADWWAARAGGDGQGHEPMRRRQGAGAGASGRGAAEGGGAGKLRAAERWEQRAPLLCSPRPPGFVGTRCGETAEGNCGPRACASEFA